MKRLLTISFLIAFSNSLLNAQTLDRVYERAKELWALRSSGNKVEALKFVEPHSQQEFLSLKEPAKAEITSIELSDVRTVVNVVSKVQMFFPEVGQIEKVNRESWVWNGADWFLHVERSSPFPFDAHAASSQPKDLPAKSVQVDFLQHQIDLGKHVQGEIIPGRLELRGEQKEIVGVRPADLVGLRFDPISWQTPDHGILKFTLDTALISESFKKELRFVFVDSSGELHTAEVEIRASIEGRVRFTQIPKALDVHADGICVLQIENLSNKPIQVLAATIGNSDFSLDSKPGTILPHGVGIMKMSYIATQGAGTSLNLTFSEDLLGKRLVVVPIQFVSAPVATPSYTREQLEEQIRKVPLPSLPRP